MNETPAVGSNRVTDKLMTKNAIITRLVIFLLAAGGIGYLSYDHDQKVTTEKA